MQRAMPDMSGQYQANRIRQPDLCQPQERFNFRIPSWVTGTSNTTFPRSVLCLLYLGILSVSAIGSAPGPLRPSPQKTPLIALQPALLESPPNIPATNFENENSLLFPPQESPLDSLLIPKAIQTLSSDILPPLQAPPAPAFLLEPISPALIEQDVAVLALAESLEKARDEANPSLSPFGPIQYQFLNPQDPGSLSISQQGFPLSPSHFPDTNPFPSSLENIGLFGGQKIDRLLHYSFQLTSWVIHDSNPTLSSTNRKGDVLVSIGPSAQIRIGNQDSEYKASAVYGAVINRYLKQTGQEDLQQRGQLQAIWTGTKLQLGLHAGLDFSHSGSRDAAQITDQRTFAGGLTTTYQAAEKLSGDLSIDNTHTTYATLLGSEEIRAIGFINYQMTPKLTAGLGGGIGSLKSDQTATQNYTQALLKLLTKPSAKLSFSASGGGEWRSVQTETKSAVTPVFNLGSQWQATAKTQFSLEAQRKVFASTTLLGQDYASTSINLNANEMLTSTIDATLGAAFEHATYKGTSANINADRKDDYYLGRAGVHWAAKRWCDISVFYEISSNQSKGAQSHPFSRDRVGLSVNLTF